VPLSPSSILVLADGRSSAGKVTAGLAESNGNLPPDGWLQITCWLTDCTAPGPTLGNEYEMTLPLPFIKPGPLFCRIALVSSIYSFYSELASVIYEGRQKSLIAVVMALQITGAECLNVHMLHG